MGLTNIMLAIPSIVFALAVMALLGPGLINVFVALGLTNWAYSCRITRSQALSAKSLDYVKAARALGYGRGRIMFTQILPNIVGPILVVATLGVAGAILVEAVIFSRAGGAAADAQLGRHALLGPGEAVHRAMDFRFPGLAIFVTVLGLNLFGDGLRDLFDPHTSRQRR